MRQLELMSVKDQPALSEKVLTLKLFIVMIIQSILQGMGQLQIAKAIEIVQHLRNRLL